jgi:Spy/CpxP family protein refolding chaperone
MNKKRTAIAALVVSGLIATTSSAAFAHDGGGKGRHGDGKRGGGRAVTSLVTAGTITQAQADAFKAAMKTKLDAKFAIKLNNVLTDLVSKSTLTQAKADAVKASSKTKKDLRDLVNAGTITSTEATAIKTALRALPKEDITVIRDEVLASLVSNNTITQAQSDAIKVAKAAWVGKMGSHHGADLGTAKTASLTY